MRKFTVLGLYEVALFGGASVTDLVYGLVPLWLWLTVTIAAVVGMPALYAPEIWRWLHGRGPKPLTGVAKDSEVSEQVTKEAIQLERVKNEYRSELMGFVVVLMFVLGFLIFFLILALRIPAP